MASEKADQGERSGSWEERIDDREFAIVDTFKSSAFFGACTGGAGLVAGSIVGIIRSRNPVVVAISTGIGCLGLGTSYSVTKEFLSYETDYDQRSKPYVSAMAGSLSGAGMGALTRGRANILPAAVVWGAAGFAGQLAFDAYRQIPAEPVKTEKKSFWDFKWSPLQKLTDDDYEILLKERLLKIDARIAIVDEDLAKLKEESKKEQARKP